MKEPVDFIRLVRLRHLGPQARHIREEAGFTLAELSDVIGVHPGTLSRWELGRSAPRGRQAARWGSVLRRLNRELVHLVEVPDDLPDWAGPIPREIVYVAAPLTATEDRTRLDEALRIVEGRYPGARVVDGTRCFAGNSDWRAVWPWMVRAIDRLVVVSSEDQSIGSGVHREIRDARNHGLHVEVLIGDRLLPIASVEFTKANPFTPRRAYTIREKS